MEFGGLKGFVFVSMNNLSACMRQLEYKLQLGGTKRGSVKCETIGKCQWRHLILKSRVCFFPALHLPTYRS